MTLRKNGNGLWPNNRGSSAQHGMGEASHVFSGGKKSGMWGNSAENEGILILHFALDDPTPKSAWTDKSVRPTGICFVGGGWNLWTEFPGGIECRARHRQRSKNFSLAEGVECFASQAFERNAEDNESDVAVFGASVRISVERNRKGGAQEFVAGVSAKKQLFVRRQAGRVRQQHAKRDFVASGIGRSIGEKLWQGAGDRRFQIEQAAFIEDHCHRRGGENFGQRRKIEKGGRGDCRVSKIPAQAELGRGTLANFRMPSLRGRERRE